MTKICPFLTTDGKEILYKTSKSAERRDLCIMSGGGKGKAPDSIYPWIKGYFCSGENV